LKITVDTLNRFCYGDAMNNGNATNCETHHHACDCREAAIRQLVHDLMELALDSRMDEDERGWKDPSRRYCELRNEAVRLGLFSAKIIDLEAK